MPCFEGNGTNIHICLNPVSIGEKGVHFVLMQANLLYRAIMLNVRTFRWARALHLAQKHNVHVATVLLERRKYLTRTGKDETDKGFQHCNTDVEVDEAEIEQQVQQELANEAARPSAAK